MQPTKYIDSLTPMRGIAALMVMLFHFNEGIRFTSDFQKNLIPNEIGGLLFKSYLWVDFFFLLSGFVIYHVYGQRYFGERVKTGKFKDFIVARLARIYPLHLAILLFLIFYQFITLLVNPSGAFTNWYSLFSLPIEFLMLDSIGLVDKLSWNFVSWSISAEWLCYLIFPFLFPLFKTDKKWVYGVLTVLAWGGLFALTLITEKKNLDATYDWGFVRGALGFLGGICVYKFYQSNFLQKLFSRDPAFLLSLAWVCAFLILDVHDVLVVIGFTPLLLSTAYNQGTIYRILNRKGFKLLGDTSYSLYMWQGPALELYFGTIFGFITSEVYGQQYGTLEYTIGAIIFCTIVFLLSLLTYYGVELPWRKRIRNWWAGRKAATEGDGH